MEKSKKRGILKCMAALMMLLCFFFLTACGREEQGSLYDFGGVEPKEIDPWVYLQDTALSSNRQVLGFASSASRLAITISMIGIVFSLLFMAARLLFCNAKTRSEVKEEAILKGMIAIMLFSISFWLGICKLIGEALI